MTSGSMFQVHTACKESLLTKCPLGLCKVSVIPPTALNSIDSDGGYHTLSRLSRFLVLPSPGLLPSPALELVMSVILRCGREEVRPSHWGERRGGDEQCPGSWAAGHLGLKARTLLEGGGSIGCLVETESKMLLRL